MNYIRSSLLLGVMSIAIIACSKQKQDDQQTPTTLSLIADYPLTTDGVDRTGFNGPMIQQNAPFQNGSTYCNGVYSISGQPDYCILETPSINRINMQGFTISMDFYTAERKSQPVWVIGSGCRWLGFYLQWDGTISMLYNNANHLFTTRSYSLNTWHNAKITYDGTTTQILLDSSLVASLKFGNGYVPLIYDQCGSDNQIGVTNYSNGEVFTGFVKNLKVYSIQ